jgi:hypothetical protein
MDGVALLIATVLVGCAAVPRATPLAIAPGSPWPAAPIASYQDAVDAVVAVMSEDLHIPVPRTSFTLSFYPHREAFARGSTEKVGIDPPIAQDLAKFALGRLRHTRHTKHLFANAEILERQPWPDRIRFVAHDITHIVQYELAERGFGGDQWLLEGFADWVAFRMQDSLGLDTFSRRRNRQIARVEQAKERGHLPSLSQLITSRDWDTLSARHGGSMTYGQAFLAAEFLIHRWGVAPVLEYFRRFARSRDRLRNFQAAFGQDLPTFEGECAAHLEHLLDRSPLSAPAAMLGTTGMGTGTAPLPMAARRWPSSADPSGRHRGDQPRPWAHSALAAASNSGWVSRS